MFGTFNFILESEGKWPLAIASWPPNMEHKASFSTTLHTQGASRRRRKKRAQVYNSIFSN